MKSPDIPGRFRLRCERSEPRNPETGGRAATEKRLSTDPLNHADSGVGLSVLDG
jgi:hypothetical protein